MTAFWILAAVLVVLALVFLLSPLLRKPRTLKAGHSAMNVELYREQFAELERDLMSGTISAGQFEESKRELERGLLQDVQVEDAVPARPQARNWQLAVALGLAVPLLAIALYLKLGSPQAIVPQQDAGNGMMAKHGDNSQLNPLIDKLAQRLKEKTPDDGEGWALLARSYIELGRYAEAAAAFDKATRLIPGNPQLLADYADAQAMANGRRFDAKTDALIKQALAIDPNHPKTLMLAGSTAFVRNNPAQAVAYWEKLITLLPPGSEEANEVAAALNDARAQLPPGAVGAEKLDNLAELSAKESTPQSAVPNAAASVSGVVSLNPQLRGKVSPTDKLRVFARAVNGPKMPLAIVEAQVKDLPFKYTLTDAMAMMPSMKLSGFPEVVVVARITKSGSAQAQSGDLQGGSSRVKVGSKDVNVTIDEVVK